MPTLNDALALARGGWHVLPLRGKVPATPHGVKDASADPAQLQRWWQRPGANIGARVPRELLVLDVDPQNGGDFAALEAAAGCALPETMTVISGRGTGGHHRYYLHPGGQLTARRLPAGIDLKTSTGYCVMPPSLHPATGNPYRWGEVITPAPLPPAVVSLLRRQLPPRPVQHALQPNGQNEHARKAAHLAQFVAGLQEGERNRGLFWAACRMAEDRHPEQSFQMLEDAAQRAGLHLSEARETIRSARRGGDAS